MKERNKFNLNILSCKMIRMNLFISFVVLCLHRYIMDKCIFHRKYKSMHFFFIYQTKKFSQHIITIQDFTIVGTLLITFKRYEADKLLANTTNFERQLLIRSFISTNLLEQMSNFRTKCWTSEFSVLSLIQIQNN